MLNQITKKQQVFTLKVAPQITDRKIDNWLDFHYVAINNSRPPINKLFLFLPGSFGLPARHSLILETAANLGCHAINLSYPNSWTVGTLCQRSKNPDCHQLVRKEIIDGLTLTGKFTIGRANSIINRLVKLLLYLNEKYPQQGWLQYLEGEYPKWESIIVAGHSQGGGHAAIIAQENLVARVIMLGAPADYSPVLNGPAPWLSAPHITPNDRYYGFVHLQDEGFENIKEAWDLLGLQGEMVNIDHHFPPLNNSRRLVTQTPVTRKQYHGSVVTDGPTPKQSDGTPVFTRIWQYLITTL